jgi:histidinol phosphatase-like enzyme (inositol monophosphatase family)
MSNWDRELDAAIAASRKAAEVALAMQAGIAFESKADGSPVTAADKACEAVIAATLLAAFPEDGLLGEEGAAADSQNGRRWIIDPIDGTRDYLRGTPLWANLIALEADGEVVVGVVNLPCLDGLYSAARGGGAFKNQAPIHASNKTSFEESVLCLNSMNKLDVLPFREKLLSSIHEFWAVRSLGGAPDAMMVASGRADFWIEPTASPWDLAPLQIIIEEAGGRMFGFDGAHGIYTGNCVACAPGLEASVRDLLGLVTVDYS